jgi:ubiquinone/menaquinone biosynthesis C-methylase UbiE
VGFYERTIFNPLMDRVLSAGPVAAERAELLALARGEILEIGAGTGLNLPHYPADVSRLTVVAPDRELDRRAHERATARGLAIDFRRGSAEQLPLADARFDTVVSTFVLCTVGDLRGAVRELGRVLRPGGRLLFLEHVVRAGRGGRRVQRALEPINRLLACGCSLVRDTGAILAGAGYRIEQLDEHDQPALPWPYRHLIRGVASLP